MLAVRIGQLTAEVFHLLDLQPCWLLRRCCHPLSWFEKNCDMQRNTVARGFKDLGRAGYVLRRRRPSSAGDWDHTETTIPALVTAWQQICDGVGPNKSKGSAQKIERVVAHKSGGDGEESWEGGAQLGPLPSEAPSDANDSGSAPTRANPDEDTILAFRGGAKFATTGPKPFDDSGIAGVVTPAQAETFRALADTFGRRRGEINNRPTLREDSDPLFADLVRIELDGYPPDIVQRAVADALRSAAAVGVRDNQDGTAGKGRGGMPSLLKYLRKLLRGTADDMLRDRDASEARNRTEQVVQQAILDQRVKAIRSNGGRTGRGTDAVMKAALGSD